MLLDLWNFVFGRYTLMLNRHFNDMYRCNFQF